MGRASEFEVGDRYFKKGSTTQLDATVSYDAATDKATLVPFNFLQRGATYKGVEAACALSKIAQHYAASPYVVVGDVGSSSPTGLEG